MNQWLHHCRSNRFTHFKQYIRNLLHHITNELIQEDYTLVLMLIILQFLKK
jgi:hypothetical protein